VDVSLLPAFNEPLDGEAPNVASILTAVNALADRSQFLQEQMLAVGASTPVAYAAAINWHALVTADVAAASINTTNTRRDGTTPAFWSQTHGCWILCGSNTVGTIYFGDFTYFTALGSLGSSPPKITFGVDAANVSDVGLVLFSSAAVLAVPIPYLREHPLGTFTKLTIAAGGTSGQTCDAVVLTSGSHVGRIVVVGGLDTNLKSWTSDDDGATFTAHTVAALGSGLFALDRVIVGAGGALFAWVNSTAGANNGDLIFKSTDDGATWTATSALGFSGIISAVYLAAEQQYVFLLATGLRVTADPMSGTWTTIALAGTQRAIAAIGSVIVLSTLLTPEVAFRPANEAIIVLRFVGQAITWLRLAHSNPFGQPTNYIALSPTQGQLCATGIATGLSFTGFTQLSGKV
jgi:hypothetical protein